MKLTLKITDMRTVSTGYSYSRDHPQRLRLLDSSDKQEEYERASIDGSGNARFIAQVLRGLADEIDPKPDRGGFA